MKFALISLIAYAITFQSQGQANQSSNKLKQQAEKMGEAFLNSNYSSFVNYIYPPILKLMGGSARTEAVLIKGANDLKAQGAGFSKITFGEPTEIIKSGKEYQATIEQQTEIKLNKGRIVTTSTLIAISVDNGNNWTFIDTSNKDLTSLRKAFPNISAMISLPTPQAPKRYDL